MMPPDQPQRPKPNMPEAARQALAAREAAAKAKAAAGVKPTVSKAPPTPPPPVVPAKPRMEVGLAGFCVWLLAAAAALSLVYWYAVAKEYESLVLPRQIVAGVVGGGLLLAIWLTQELEKDARLVKLVWVIAVLTLVAAPVVFLVTRSTEAPVQKKGPIGRFPPARK